MSKKILFLISFSFLVIIFAGTNALAAVERLERPERPEREGRVVSNKAEETIQAVSLGCVVLKEVKTLRALRCPKEVAENLSLNEDVRVFALDDEKNRAVRISRSKTTNASVGPLQQIGADIVQASGNTGNSRKVAVLDTGYNYFHPELISSFLEGWDFVNNDNDPFDDNGHGSHVAGIITADGVDPKAKGVAPDAGVIAGKVLDQDGAGYFSDVVAAIYWVIDGPDGIYGNADDFGVDVINLSLGTSPPYTYKNGYCDNVLPDLTTAIKYAKDKGVVVATAAGNSGSSGVSIPGCISYSTTVGAVNKYDKVASFSGRGNAVDISAPGVSIFSSILNNSYATWSGTSMATPMVSGVVALIKSAHSAYTSSQVENALFNTAKDLGKRGKDTSYGYGRVNATPAVK